MFEYYYNEILRKTIIAFGTMFNNISIKHFDKNNNVVDVIKVPLAYGPTQKFLARIEQSPDLNKSTAITLPRMSFEFNGLKYDSSRKVTTTQQFVAIDSEEGAKKTYMPVPYNMEFELSIMAKVNDDMLQIVEQILPTFNPQYTLSIFPFKDIYPDFVEDVPIVITSVTFEDDYQSTLEQRRTIVYNLTFEMKVQFYGDIENKDVIRTSNAKLFNMNAGLNDSDIYLERVTVTPNPTTVFGMPDSDFGFTTAIVSAGDSL